MRRGFARVGLRVSLFSCHLVSSPQNVVGAVSDFRSFADAKLFYHLEDWLPNPEADNTTMYLARLADFQKFNATVAYFTAGGSEKSSGSSRSRPVNLLFGLDLCLVADENGHLLLFV